MITIRNCCILAKCQVVFSYLILNKLTLLLNYFTSIEILGVTCLLIYHRQEKQIWTHLDSVRLASSSLLPCAASTEPHCLHGCFPSCEKMYSEKQKDYNPFPDITGIGRVAENTLTVVRVRDFSAHCFLTPIVQNLNSGRDWLCSPTTWMGRRLQEGIQDGFLYVNTWTCSGCGLLYTKQIKR